MRCYLVVGGGMKRYAGTQALARQTREEIVVATGVKKSAVMINEAEIPYGKAELLEFVNDLLAEQDDAPEKPKSKVVKSKNKSKLVEEEEEEE